MMEEIIAMFLEEFGEPDSIEPLGIEIIETYEDIPDILRALWRRYGWCSFANGLFWLTEPKLHASRIVEWTKSFEVSKADTWIVFARTAFGKLFCYQEKSARILRLGTPNGFAITQRKPQKSIQSSLEAFFAMHQRESCDLYDFKEELMFNAALKSVGRLGGNEVYGFKQLLTQGGRATPENLIRRDFLEYLDEMVKVDKPVLRLN